MLATALALSIRVRVVCSD